MDCTAYHDIVAADVDGLLDTRQQSAATAHVATCSRCASVRRAAAMTTELLRERAPRHETPAAVRQRMIAALDREGAPVSPLAAPRRGHVSRKRLALIGALAAGVALLLVSTWQSPAPDLLAVLVRDVHAASTPQVPLAIRTDDVDSLRQYYRSTGRIDFDRTVPDLSTAGFRPIGGSVAKIGAVDTTLTAYEGPLGKVVCRRFRAGGLELPAGGERIGEATVFTVQGITVRFQRDGDVICCLASAIPRDLFVRYLIGQHNHDPVPGAD